MQISERAVIVKEVPQNCSPRNSRQFLRDLVFELAQVARPAVVLDCLRAERIDRQTLRLFIWCLEEAMKRNGDVRIAGLHQDALPVLEAAGVARLLRTYPTTTDAIESYQRPAFEKLPVDAAEDGPKANAA